MGILNNLSCKIKSAFGGKNAAKCEKEMRENKSQKEIDKTLKDSFPASDPPSTY